ncbi:cysteine/serine-rich nuclear protein 3-like isoform X1 [Epinephelus fuscoguttatus]|uniref:cysteine/serine-rich nuclear protein 3-like isoform X1 n=1 Tax=Epinephelus fuscoguttatus TaxID=293821 RepID=UPI0020D16206|nr:cysteine/serine-rich nuclear protein 3-like isoform X1 [Epinephelus fuscoguttatus]XP_049426627.1 cysteine/serine-rich nuclear protein 3-like isoform X1 [Epinephelus fuscoguttatus]
MMSGILKRKLEEGPSPYLSLQGSDDEVSCSDSGNSSDSLNHPVPSGLLDSTLQQKSKRLRGRNVHFESVTVYYFNRRQGFTSVPTQGGSTLGMSPRHSGVKRFTLREFALEQKRSHRNMLREHLKEEKLNAVKLKLTKNGTVSSVEADNLTLDDISEDDLDVDNTEVDDYFFLQPLTTRRRRVLLRASGVRRIEVEEKHELRALRMSREECGCRCRGICDPETCACSLAGIKCQVNGTVVDRMSFPCGCTKEGCSNNTGRLEFNPVRVRTHFLHTIMKLELEKSREEQQQQQQHQQQQPEQQLVTNGNGYHGDSSLVQQQQQQPPPNLQFPLMSGTPHIPIMHLQNTGDTDSHLDEEEEEEEEEEDEEDEDDEAYEEDEDGSSVCSGLSDCSTHSLETIDPEEEEEDEEDEEEDDDDEEEDDEEEEEDWDCSLHGTSPPPYSVPLPSVLSYTNNTLMSLSNPFHSTPSMQHYQMDSSVNDSPAFLSENVTVTPTLPTVETALESEINPELRRQTEQQSIPCHFPDPTESLTLQTCSHVDTRESNTAPAGAADEQPLSTDLQNNPDHHDSQTEAGSVEQTEEEIRQPIKERPGLQTQGDADQITDTSCSEST